MLLICCAVTLSARVVLSEELQPSLRLRRTQKPIANREGSANVDNSRRPIRSSIQKGLEVCYCFWGVPFRPSPGSYPGPVHVPPRVRGGPVQIRHVLCFTVFRTHPGPEVGAIPARPGPILLPSVPYRIGPGRAETDFLATSDPCQNERCANECHLRDSNRKATNAGSMSTKICVLGGDPTANTHLRFESR